MVNQQIKVQINSEILRWDTDATGVNYAGRNSSTYF